MTARRSDHGFQQFRLTGDAVSERPCRGPGRHGARPRVRQRHDCLVSPDRLDTVRDLINNSGAIIDHIDYSAFGTVLDRVAPSEGDRMMGFAGMEQDAVTGLNLAVYPRGESGDGEVD